MGCHIGDTALSKIKCLYVLIVGLSLSVLEQSCVVWNSSLTQENEENLERTQKTFCKLVLREKYKNYENSLTLLNLESLKERRQILSLKFAKSGIKFEKMKDLFPEKEKNININTRNNEKFKVNHANTERLKTSSVISMQKLLNLNAIEERKQQK